MNNFLVKKTLWIFSIILCAKSVYPQDTNPIKPNAYSSNSKVNYVRTWEALKPDTNATNINASTPFTDFRMTTQYMDGLGRQIQTVIKQGSLPSAGTPVDFVSPVVYDTFGREIRKYLPFSSAGNTGIFKLNPFQEQANFYGDNINGPIKNQGESYYYSKAEFEPSPLNRIERSYAPGNSWVHDGKGVKMKYWINTAADEVRIWNVSDAITPLGTFTSPPGSTYPAGQLYKTVTVDENDKQVIEFKDKEGKIILKKVQLDPAVSDNGLGKNHTGWLCTYYIYDDFGNLRCVIQPRGVEGLQLTNWDLHHLSDVLINEQCFRYVYDARGRMVFKKVPGAEGVFMVYDALDRLVMTQDGKLRLENKWLVTSYDRLNRPVTTHFIIDSTHNVIYHLINAAGSTSYPNLNDYSSSAELITQLGYDEYGSFASYADLDNTHTNGNIYGSASSNIFPYSQPLTKSDLTKGMVAWTLTKVLGTATYLASANIYDDKGRVIQQKSLNMHGAIDIVTTEYSWMGTPLTQIEKREKPGTPSQTTLTVTRYMYDPIYRISSIVKKASNSLVNAGAVPSTFKTILVNEYNALGQLKKKSVGTKPDGTSRLAKQEYEYNIRGWLLSSNKNYITTSTNDDEYFGMQLGYEKSGAFMPQYNGNISSTIWKSEGDQVKRKYDYSYDAVNRLTFADFKQDEGSGFVKSATVDFSEGGITYDANGNIKTYIRTGLKLNTSPIIDQLTYTYQISDFSNKLAKVTDQVSLSDNGKLGDFKDGTNDSSDYSYDVNGNLVLDHNKAISNITYNYLNLPSVITVTGKGTISYTYDGVGNKLQKVILENAATVVYNGTNYTSNVTITTNYLGSGVYESKAYSNPSLASLQYTDRLQFIGHEEGRVRFKLDDNSLQYDYFLKDHLGNTRMVLTEEQQIDIYPAATLEGSITSDGVPNAIFREKDYYSIGAGVITDSSEATGITAYPNNNVIVANPNPNSNTAANSEKLLKLQASTSAGVTGLGITLKVMSGDKINILGKSYYFQNNAGSSNYNIPVLDILTSLLGSATGAAAGKGATASGLNAVPDINSLLSLFLQLPTRSDGGTSTTPKAYINWILFDENFKPVAGNFSRVGVPNLVKSHFADAQLQNIAVTKNGYLHVYCSNESPVKVFFDNLQVVHTRGPILEETHYYPFGLTMAGISSKAMGKVENKKKFNDGTELANKEFSDGSGLELYETTFRSYDPQIGRFHQIDPVAVLAYDESGYHFSNNNPIIYNDPLGLTSSRFEENQNITGWVDDPERGVYFDPDVHDQKDVKPGQTYLGEEIIITDENGNAIGYGNDQGGISYNVDLAPVTVTPANNYSFAKGGLGTDHSFRLLPKGTDYSDYGDFGGHTLFWLSKLFESNIQYDIQGNVTGYSNIQGGVAPSGAFGKLNPKDALKLAKILKNLLRKGRAPKEIKRIDIPGLDKRTGLPDHGQQPHIHFQDGRALNFDGTWKHGGGEITNKILKWIQENL